ncbi:MAG: hypothetical protein AAGA25_15785 [Planctomycetota bacterium]
MPIDPAIQQAGIDNLGGLLRACQGDAEMQDWTQADIDAMVEAQLDVPLDLPSGDPSTPPTARQLLGFALGDRSLLTQAERFYTACAKHPESEIPTPVANAIAHYLQLALAMGPPSRPPP